MQTEIEKRYRKLSEIEHILHRPGMYIGSISTVDDKLVVLDHDDLFIYDDVHYVPGILKLIDEIISNSIDEYRRKNNLGLDRIRVEISKDGWVSVYDNGGIPVVMHEEYGCYVPDLIFGHLRAGSNFDDTEERNVVGTNGVGSTLANIFSTEFQIVTADGKNQYMQKWKNHMHERVKNEDGNEYSIVECKDHFTKVVFKIDLQYFGVESLSDGTIKMVEKRCIDAAASNAGLEITFVHDGKEKKFKFKSFAEYVKMYPKFIDVENMIGEKNEDWEIYIAPHYYMHVGIVNGAPCNSGTHFQLLTSRVNEILQKHLLSKYGINITYNNLTTKYSCFICMDVINPSYDSQTKERLETKDTKLTKKGPVQEFSKGFIKQIIESEILKSILDWHENKVKAEESRKLRSANKEIKNIAKIPKLIDANANSKNRDECELFIFEGASAISGLRASRDPQTQAGYALRGKVKNVVNSTHKDIIANNELRDIIAAINLRFGEPENADNLRYSKIIICTDMDPDGHSIAGMLIAFFVVHYPGVVKSGKLYRALSPIIIAKNKNKKRFFYSYEDYKKAEDTLDGWSLRYIKGLGGLEASDYKEMLLNPVLEQLVFDEDAVEMVNAWFTDSSTKRKELLEAM